LWIEAKMLCIVVFLGVGKRGADSVLPGRREGLELVMGHEVERARAVVELKNGDIGIGESNKSASGDVDVEQCDFEEFGEGGKGVDGFIIEGGKFIRSELRERE
jgi:hypothetical protein